MPIGLRRRDPRNLHQPIEVRQGLRERRRHEGGAGVLQGLRALVRQRRRAPPPDEDSQMRQRVVKALDQVA